MSVVGVATSKSAVLVSTRLGWMLFVCVVSVVTCPVTLSTRLRALEDST
jgi:hypothetical protein